MPSSSEFDPLLPKNEPAPEIITGNVDHSYGTANYQKPKLEDISYDDSYPQTDPSHVYGDGNGKDYYDSTVGGGGNSPPEDRETTAAADEDNESDSDVRSFALRSLGSLFAVAVLFTLLVAYLLPGELHFPWGDDSPPPHSPSRSPSSYPSSPVSPSASPSAPPSSIPSRVAAILKDTPLLDGHDDLAILLRYAYGNDIKDPEFREKFEKGGLRGHVDIPKLRDGMVGGGFWSAFVGCPKNASWDFSDEVYAEASSQTLAQIDVLRRLGWQYPTLFSAPFLSPSEYLASFRASNATLLISPLSIEGLHQLPPSAPFSTLRNYRALGVRAATLTWNCHNAFADAALITEPGEGTVVAPPTPGRDGLSERGRAVVKEMNRIGVLVDLSHTSYATQRAVLGSGSGSSSGFSSGEDDIEGASAAPVIYSHSSVFALCPHPRNVHDDMLDRVRATNSLVMINFAPDFISCLPPPSPSELPELYEPNNTFSQVVNHITYIGARIGYAHVGLGSDFDGIASTPRGLEGGVKDFPRLVEELLERGVGEEEVKGVVGGNLLRVWEDAERVRGEMQGRGVEEGVDDVEEFPGMWGDLP